MQFTFDIAQKIAQAILPYPKEQVFLLSSAGILSQQRAVFRAIPELLPKEHTLLIEDDEAHKSLDTVQLIWDFLLAHQATRSALLICMGGGIITDLGGFAASTYKRGIDFLHIPTTLLAMVDASTGGKTGFNYHGLKNSIGVFSQPIDTLICPLFLQSLPATDMLSGLGEMYKHALIDSEETWQTLRQFDISRLFVADDAKREAALHDFAPLIAASLAVKERIVAADPTEHGLRHTLNFGHTIGHAIEEYYIERSIHPLPRHGYCVLWGMIAELYLSVQQVEQQNQLPEEKPNQSTEQPNQPTEQSNPPAAGLRDALQYLIGLMNEYYGKPICSCSEYGRMLEIIRQDKKNTVTPKGEIAIRFVLLEDVGKPLYDRTITEATIAQSLDYLFSL